MGQVPKKDQNRLAFHNFAHLLVDKQTKQVIVRESSEKGIYFVERISDRRFLNQFFPGLLAGPTITDMGICDLMDKGLDFMEVSY